MRTGQQVPSPSSAYEASQVEKKAVQQRGCTSVMDEANLAPIAKQHVNQLRPKDDEVKDAVTSAFTSGRAM